jgi:hypothetical protein
MTTMPELPPSAAWRHVDARDGFEVVFLRRRGDGYHLDGHATAVEEGTAWGVRYAFELDAAWRTRAAHVVEQSAAGTREARLEGDGSGAWRLDGVAAAHLSGCLDVDLEASACTNALPVLRLGLREGERAEAPAAYVRSPGLAVERLEQSYERLSGEGDEARYDYLSPAFDFRAVLVYDRFGLVVDYPGIAVRVA